MIKYLPSCFWKLLIYSRFLFQSLYFLPWICRGRLISTGKSGQFFPISASSVTDRLRRIKNPIFGLIPLRRQLRNTMDLSDWPRGIWRSQKFIGVFTVMMQSMWSHPESKHSLTEAEKKMIDQWSKDGGKYDKHWSFQPLPKSVAVPASKHPSTRNEID